MAGLDGGGAEQLAAVRGVVPSREDVAADVRRVIGGCRSRGDYARVATPAIDQLLALDGRPHEDGPDLLARAIDAVDREAYRRFLEILLPFPFEEGERWSSLGPSRRGPGRGDEAATVFGLDTWDGCTRPSLALDGRSRRDWAELHLATALIAVATAGLEGDGRGIRRSRGGSDGLVPDGSRWRPRAAVLVAATVGFAAIAAVIVLLVGGHDRPAAAGSTETVTTTAVGARVLPKQCVRIGSLSDDVAAEPDAPQDAATLRSVYEAAGGDQLLGCGVAPAHRWRGLLVQEYEGEPGLPGAVVVTGPGTGIVLDPAQWGSYRRVGAADGTQALRVGGVPDRIVQRPDGSVEVELSHGVVMVAESRDAPYFWISADYVAWWRSHPELGLPTANPLASLTQDFQHGHAEVTATSSGLSAEPRITLVDDPAAELPAPAARRGHILRQPDGTAWWIDAQDRRHWIATGEVWDCLGGDAVAVSADVPGYAVATLPLGSHAACSKGG